MDRFARGTLGSCGIKCVSCEPRCGRASCDGMILGLSLQGLRHGGGNAHGGESQLFFVVVVRPGPASSGMLTSTKYQPHVPHEEPSSVAATPRSTLP
eukprot:3934813-Rhodomonas_salina.7